MGLTQISTSLVQNVNRFNLYFQYDIELYQRIEQLISKKLPLYQVDDNEVMCLQERVSEAQRLAIMVNVYYLFFLLFFS